MGQLIELRSLKNPNPMSSGSSSQPNFAGMPANALTISSLTHKCSALASKVRRLEDELHSVEVQGGVRALVEAQGLVEALQTELSIKGRKIRKLEKEVVSAKWRAKETGRSVSGSCTPSLTGEDDDGEAHDDDWEQRNLELEARERVEQAEMLLKKEVEGERIGGTANHPHRVVRGDTEESENASFVAEDEDDVDD